MSSLRLDVMMTSSLHHVHVKRRHLLVTVILAWHVSSPAGFLATALTSIVSSIVHFSSDRIDTESPFRSFVSIFRRSVGSRGSSPLNHVISGRGLPLAVQFIFAVVPSLASQLVSLTVNFGTSIFSEIE